jgi:hypothetical protein
MADIAEPTEAERLATQENALNLGRIALIGTMGTESDPQALVRLPGGRITRVAVGDELDGKRVDAIEAERLLMSRNGRQSVLEMPSG